ncbi:MAG: hypothetical protein JWM98_2750, partial [Thermoleophilia bacterium]|nr:hypothetical protein [Thermoleophilia bacterium]
MRETTSTRAQRRAPDGGRTHLVVLAIVIAVLGLAFWAGYEKA